MAYWYTVVTFVLDYTNRLVSIDLIGNKNQVNRIVHTCISLHSILQVDKLEVRYSLPGREGTEISVIQDEKCIQSENLIMFHKNYVGSSGEVNKELASFFSNQQKECTLYLM